MSKSTLIQSIEDNILTGGRRTTAVNTRTVLTALVNEGFNIGDATADALDNAHLVPILQGSETRLVSLSTLSTFFGGGSDGWSLDGNTVISEKWFGTIDEFDVPIRTFDTEIAKFTTAGNFNVYNKAVIGSSSIVPTGALEVYGGRVGIGVAPTSILDIKSAATADWIKLSKGTTAQLYFGYTNTGGGYLTLRDAADTVNLININYSGDTAYDYWNTGRDLIIGATSTPNGKLDVRGSVFFKSGGSDILDLQKSNGHYLVAFRNADTIDFFASNVVTSTIRNGYFGANIGANTPAAPIHAKGATNAAGSNTALFYNSDNDLSVVICDNGYVGFNGNTAPDAPLHVVCESSKGLKFMLAGQNPDRFSFYCGSDQEFYFDAVNSAFHFRDVNSGIEKFSINTGAAPGRINANTDGVSSAIHNDGHFNIQTSNAVDSNALNVLNNVASSATTQYAGKFSITGANTKNVAGYFSATGGTTNYAIEVAAGYSLFAGNIVFSGGYGIDTTVTGGTDTLNIGATNAEVINIGHAGVTVNILGTALYEYAANQYVLDKLITLNYNGAVSSGAGVGFEIEENSVITGYFKTNATRNGYSLLTPAIAYKSDISLASLTADRVHTLPDLAGTFALTANKLSVFAATTSSELAGVISDETGSGALVFATSPTLVTPTLGVATATTYNKVAITAPATGSTLTIIDGKTVTISNTLTFTGTDSSTVVFGAGGTVLYAANNLSDVSSPFTSMNNLGVVTQYPTSDPNTTSGTEVAITGLTFALAANAVYKVDGIYKAGCSGTGGVVFAITLPASTTLHVSYFGNGASATALLRTQNTASATLSTTPHANFVTTNAIVNVRGTIRTGATSGNAVFGYAAFSAGQTATIYTEGSWLTLTRTS